MRTTTQVLVVDDDPGIRAVLVDCLSDAGFAVHEATNGVEALVEMGRRRPDVIVLDLMMPVMDGRAFAEACHRSAGLDGIPILLLSATPGLSHIATQLKGLGVQAYLPKPFDLDVLVQAAEELVSAPTAA